MRINPRVRDGLLLAAGIGLVLFLLQAPEETTPTVPHDPQHDPFHKLAAQKGKKAAEAQCHQCHGEGGIPFPEEHPPPNRCLFCHKVNSE